MGRATLRSCLEDHITVIMNGWPTLYAGNAAIMRCLPLAFVPARFRLPLCTVSADATHPHPKSRLSCFLMAAAAAFLIPGCSHQQPGTSSDPPHQQQKEPCGEGGSDDHGAGEPLQVIQHCINIGKAPLFMGYVRWFRKVVMPGGCARWLC